MAMEMEMAPDVILTKLNITMNLGVPSEEEDSTDGIKDPFHCPSKPWKMFTPAPTEATIDPTLVDGALADLDLLG